MQGRNPNSYGRPGPLLAMIMVLLGGALLPASEGRANDGDDAWQTRLREAGLPSTGAGRLQVLARDPLSRVRRAVAANRRSPPALLLHLARDPERAVKIAVATNLSTPEEAFMLLAADADVQVRSVVARFEYVPAVVLDRLAEDPEPDIRLEVARSFNTTRATLRRLLQDRWQQVRQTAALALARREQAGD